MFKIFSASLQKANEKAEKAIYTSDMDTEQEARYSRKYRAKKILSSSESEDDSNRSVTLPSPPCPPVKRKYNNFITLTMPVYMYIYLRNL